MERVQVCNFDPPRWRAAAGNSSRSDLSNLAALSPKLTLQIPFSVAATSICPNAHLAVR